MFIGYVTVALTFLATERGLSIAEGAFIDSALLLVSWCKWSWAPVVDVTLSPRRWYVLSIGAVVAGICAITSIPLGPSTLGLVLVLVTATAVCNSMVAMAVEAMMAAHAQPGSISRISGWLQAGHCGARSAGGALGLWLLTTLEHRWMAGGVLGVIILGSSAALVYAPPDGPPHTERVRERAANVLHSLRDMLRTRVGLLAAVLCVLPLGGGQAALVLTQARVAAQWGAGVREITLLQGFLSTLLAVVGSFAGAWLCRRMRAQKAYFVLGILLVATSAIMAIAPATLGVYIACNVAFATLAGGTYSTFTALALEAMGRDVGATKYSVLSSLAYFPGWWMAILLGFAAQRHGPRIMLLVEAGVGALAAVGFLVFSRLVRRSRLSASPGRA